jgi:hypothetical protein
MTPLDLAWLYAKLAIDLAPRVDGDRAEQMAQHRANAVLHISLAGDPSYDPNQIKESIAQMLKLAGVIN